MAGWEPCTSRSNSSSPTNSAGLSPSRTTARSSKSWTATGPATPRGRLASPSDERSLRFIALCAAGRWSALNRGDVEQRTPGGVFGDSLIFVADTDVERGPREQRHFRMTYFIALATGKDDPEWLEGSFLQETSERFDGHKAPAILSCVSRLITPP